MACARPFKHQISPFEMMFERSQHPNLIGGACFKILDGLVLATMFSLLLYLST